MIDSENAFPGEEKDLRIYNGVPLLDLPFVFVYDDEDATPFTFPAYSSGFLRLYNTRDGKMIKNYTTQVTKSSNALILNCSVADMTFTEKGKRYYELGYVRSGGYDIILRYGPCEVV